MAKLYTYMIGIEPKYWTKDDEYACESYDIVNKGYYELGFNQGMILVGTLKNLKDIMKEYFDYSMNDDYLCPADSFDFEDGEWITGGWNESKKSVRKSIKESRETIRVDISTNEDIFTYFNPMKKGLTSVQFSSDIGGNWAKVEKPNMNVSGYFYFENGMSYIQYDFTKVDYVEIDWGNHQIYFFTKSDWLMMHFYNLSDEEFKFLMNGDTYLNGIITAFEK